jgi:deoxyribose-phosphate aldolase
MDKVTEIAKMIDRSILHPAFTDDDLKRECEVARKYNVASVCVKPYAVKQAVEFVKGPDVKFSYTGATAHDLALMKKHLAPRVKVKAAGGVRTLSDLLKYKEIGISRCGATATAAMLEDAKKIYGKK